MSFACIQAGILSLWDGHGLMLRSVVPDLRSLSRPEVAVLLLFGCTVVVFNIIDFNSLVHTSADPKIKFESDKELGLELWRRALMTLSGAASFTGAMCVVLTSHQRLSCFFWGTINCVLYGLFCFAYGYSGDAQLNIVFFLPLQYLGIIQWMSEMRRAKEARKVQIRSLTWSQRVGYLVLAGAVAVGFYYEIPEFAKALTGYYFFDGFDAPHRLDAANNGLSIVAQLLLTQRYWESWVLWIAINCIQISMFSGIATNAVPDFNIVLMLCLFLVNSIFGCYKWFTSAHGIYMPVSKSSSVGLVIGKFWPFHRGHAYLIDTASRNCETLHIILCYRETEQPDVHIREAAIREMYPGASLHLLLDIYDQDDSQLWAKLTVDKLGFAPDIVFTSESYGERYCKYLQCEHYLVDLDRKTVPTSGTCIRSNPLVSFDYLTPPLKQFYARRVVLVGPESTGKSTLAERLAEHYNTEWVQEYGRVVTERLIADKRKATEGGNTRNGDFESADWQANDFIDIATFQNKMEMEACRRCSGILICDTDCFATTIWHERYMKSRSEVLEQIVQDFQKESNWSTRHYLLLSATGVPFVQDGTRDGEALRQWMEGRFVDELERRGWSFSVLSGDFVDRERAAMSFIDAHLGKSEHCT